VHEGTEAHALDLAPDTETSGPSGAWWRGSAGPIFASGARVHCGSSQFRAGREQRRLGSWTPGPMP